MTKKHEELVGEVYEKMANFFGGLVVYPEIKVPMSERLTFTKQIITLILSAVRDGELDEELGVSKEEIEKELAFALGKEEEVLETNDIPRYCEHCGSEEHYTSEHY